MAMWSRVRTAPSRASSVTSRDWRAGLEVDASKTEPHAGESPVYTWRGPMSVIAGTRTAGGVGDRDTERQSEALEEGWVFWLAVCIRLRLAQTMRRTHSR